MIRWIFTAILGLAVYPFLREAMRKGPDFDAAPGELVELSQGITHYRWDGPVRGPVAVCIHGASTPHQAYHAIIARLTASGYRVLSYDLYGRGFSSNAKGPQDRAFHLTQLTELLADQGLEDDLTIFGYSMGGMIATAFCAANPHRIKRMIILASGGVNVDIGGVDEIIVRRKHFGRWLYYSLGARGLAKDIRASSVEPSEVDGIYQIQLAELHRKGFRGALVDSMQGFEGDSFEGDHRKLGKDGVPVVAIWGDQDDVIPISSVGTLAVWNRAARQEVVKGAGHGLPYTHATQVMDLLSGILQE